MNIVNVPNILTISRMFLLPVIVYLFFVHTQISDILVSFIFIFCCITDFLDGFLARVHKQATPIGQVLDPMADKVLIVTTIFCIGVFQKISGITMIPACIILCREVIVSDIRDFILANKIKFKTAVLAKWKTALQMTALSVILVGNAFFISYAICIGEILLWLSAILSIISGILYFMRYYNTFAI